MLSEGEPLVGVTLQQVIRDSFKPKADDQEMAMLKSAGPSRNNEKLKRSGVRLYSRPRRHVGDGVKIETEDANGMINFVAADDRSGDQVMVDTGLGIFALPSSPADPTPLTGPQDDARQEQ
jgi:hypothetical protein